MTCMRFAGRLAPNVKNVRPSANSPCDDIVTFTCGHVRIISPALREKLIDAGGHPVCLQCDGAAPAEPKPGPLSTLERWTEHGQSRCPSVSPVTDRHQCRLAIGHAPGHVSDCGKFEWADNPRYHLRTFYTDERGVPDGGARVQREARERQASADLTSLANGDRLGPDATANAMTVQDRLDRLRNNAEEAAKAAAAADCRFFEADAKVNALTYRRDVAEWARGAFKTPKPMPPTAPGLDRVDALALTQHVTNLEHKLRRLEERHAAILLLVVGSR